MDLKYVTPFALIAVAFCLQSLGVASLLAAPPLPGPVLEIPAAFTRV